MGAVYIQNSFRAGRARKGESFPSPMGLALEPLLTALDEFINSLVLSP